MCQDFVQNIRLAGVIPEINSSYVVVFAEDCQAVPKRRLNLGNLFNFEFDFNLA